MGYVLQTLIALLSAGTKALREPGNKHPFLFFSDMLTMCVDVAIGKLKRALLNTYNAKFGAFLATLAGGFKVSNFIHSYPKLPYLSACSSL